MGLRTGGRRAKCLKNRVKSSKIELRFREVRPQGCSSRSPVQQALIYPFIALLQFCFGRTAFLLPASQLDWGARLRMSGGCPVRGEPDAHLNPAQSIAGTAKPCQRCTSVQQALIYSLIMLKKPGNTLFPGFFYTQNSVWTVRF